MKNTLALLSCLFAFILMASAQNVAGKINKTNNKISNTDTAVQGTTAAINGASSTLGNAGNALSNLGNTFGGMLKRKPKPGAAKTAGTPDTATQAKQEGNANIIMISIASADYASLKKLKESLKAVTGVQSVNMNYDSTGSSLSIACNKKADDLWDGLSNDVSARYNIISMNGNAINIAYKQ